MCDTQQTRYWRVLGRSFPLRLERRNATNHQMNKNTQTSRRISSGSIRSVLASVFVAILFVPSSSAADTQGPTQVGWVEKVCLFPGGFRLPAKVDTGAVTCSLHAPNPTVHEKDGKKWVRFRIKDADGKDVTIERPVIGTRRIKRHFGKYQQQLVIKMGVCLGSLYREAEVSLVDRTGFEYPMLIGRDFMENAIVVNPSAKNMAEPVCRMEE